MRDYSDLRAKAEAATPGEWRIVTFGQLSVQDARYMLGDADAGFIRAAQPVEILALLDELEALRSQVKPAKPKRNDYPAEFVEAWDAYPPRAGASKRTAFKAWGARIKAGVLPADILAGVKRYAAYVLAERTEERYIKQPATFFGPDEHFDLPWASSRAPAGRQSVNDEAKRRLFGGFDEFGSTDAPR